jgi:hypothetical protein
LIAGLVEPDWTVDACTLVSKIRFRKK